MARLARRPTGRLLAAFLAALGTTVLGAGTALAAPTVRGDFDGDGRSDLAIGAPDDSVQGQEAAGAVNVLYGSPGGLTASGDQQFTKASQRISGTPQAGARFGAALAAGDVDGDGLADLAIGAPGEDVGGLEGQPAAGAVTVLYGSRGGLRTRPAAGGWSQSSVGVKGGPESGDRFGAALAVGDFDGDGIGDLAIGVPGDSVGGQADAGAVNVLYGQPEGLTAGGDQLWTQDTRGVKGVAGSGHRFGAALAAGDASENGRDELAIGIPGGTISGQAEAGAVSVLYGRGGGLTSVDDLWSQDAAGIEGVAEPNESFGSAVAIGDFDGDGAGDLAVGVPTESVGSAAGAGAVNVIYGSASGLREDPDRIWTQDTPGIKSRASIGDTFGAALAAGDFSRNGVDDLAIGVPGEAVDTQTNAGSVNVLYGNAGRGLGDRSDQLWSQDTPGIEGVAQQADRFGHVLGIGDFDGDGDLELAVGVPGGREAGFSTAGGVNTIHGSPSGLGEDPDRRLTQATPGITGAVGNDRFGAALAGGLPAGE